MFFDEPRDEVATGCVGGVDADGLAGGGSARTVAEVEYAAVVVLFRELCLLS